VDSSAITEKNGETNISFKNTRDLKENDQDVECATELFKRRALIP